MLCFALLDRLLASGLFTQCVISATCDFYGALVKGRSIQEINQCTCPDENIKLHCLDVFIHLFLAMYTTY